MKKKLLLVCLACACLWVLSPACFSGTVIGTSTVETGSWSFLDGSTYEYKYTIDLLWDCTKQEMSKGLSHVDFDFENALQCDYALYDDMGEPTGNIRFEDIATYQVEGDPTFYNYTSGIDGSSNWEESPDPAVDDGSVDWGGFIDTMANMGDAGRIIRYQQPLEADGGPPPPETLDPGISGRGTFSFYSHLAPVHTAENPEFAGDVTLKSGQDEITHVGALTGALPYCEPIPEPATMALLALGGLLLRRKK